MITALPGTIAVFEPVDGGATSRFVQAWDDEGRALVDDGLGVLVIANEQPGFLRTQLATY